MAYRDIGVSWLPFSSVQKARTSSWFTVTAGNLSPDIALTNYSMITDLVNPFVHCRQKVRMPVYSGLGNYLANDPSSHWQAEKTVSILVPYSCPFHVKPTAEEDPSDVQMLKEKSALLLSCTANLTQKKGSLTSITTTWDPFCRGEGRKYALLILACEHSLKKTGEYLIANPAQDMVLFCTAHVYGNTVNPLKYRIQNIQRYGSWIIPLVHILFKTHANLYSAISNNVIFSLGV